MRCNRVDHLLPAYLEDDLAPALSERVDAHLEACARCQEQLALQRQAMRLLDHGRHSPSIDLWADFSQRLQERSPQRPSPWRLLWQPGLASALAAVVVGLVARSGPAPAPFVVENRTRPSARAASPVGAREDYARSTGWATRAGRRDGGSRSRREQRQLIAVVPQARREEAAVSRRLQRPRRAVQVARAVSRPRSIERRPGLATGRIQPELRTRMVQLASAASPAGRSDFSGGQRQPSQAELSRAAAGPLAVAEALVEAQQDAAADRVRGELLLLAQQVALVGGEATSGMDAAVTAGS
jgi:hypothetical protein